MSSILLWVFRNRFMFIFGLIISIGCILLILFNHSNEDDVLNVQYATAFMIIFVVAICLMRSNFFLDIQSIAHKENRAEPMITDTDQPKYRTISLDDEKCKSYIKILENTMVTTKIYLRPGLSLDELSTITNIPRHHFSNLLNVHMGKTFYQYISEYRIQEAILRIENEDNMTMESLSYECGFNSKTSFNRYFKNATGSTPSEYRRIKMVAV